MANDLANAFRFYFKNNKDNKMTELEAIKLLGFSIGVAACFGFVFGVIIFWVPKNIK